MSLDVTQPTAISTHRLPQAFANELDARRHELEKLAERYEFVASVEATLAAVTRGKLFYIVGLSAWRTLIGERAALVIDLASWVKGMHGTGSKHHAPGLLRRIAEEEAARTALAAAWEQKIPQPEWVVKQNETGRVDRFRRLFASGVGAPSREDVLALAETLDTNSNSLRVDRNRHRAHRFEDLRNDKPDAIGMAAVRAHLERFQAIVSDLFFLSSNCSWSGLMLNVSEGDTCARDFADLILRGTIGFIVHEHASKGGGAHYWQSRTAHYEALHAAHEAAGAPPDIGFNSPIKDN